MKDFILRFVCYFKYLNEIFMRKVIYFMIVFIGRWVRKLYRRISVFWLYFISYEGVRFSFLVLVLLVFYLVRLLCVS